MKLPLLKVLPKLVPHPLRFWRRLRSLDFKLVYYYARVYVKEGWQLTVRNRFLSVFAGVTIFTLLTMGYALIVLNSHLNQVLSQADSNLIVTVVVDKDASAATVQQEIRALPGVGRIHYISQQQSRDDFVKRTNIPQGSIPNANLFPQILEVHTTNANQIPILSNKIRGLPGVYETNYLKNLVQQITGTTRGLRIMALFTLIFLGVLSIGLLMAIVRVTIYAKKKNVQIMSLVGATRATITLPLLAQVALITLIAGTLACLVGWVIDPQLGVGSSLIAGHKDLPDWLRTTRAYGLFTLWPVIVPAFLVVASLVVVQSVRRHVRR